jgi:hypothetical protein
MNYFIKIAPIVILFMTCSYSCSSINYNSVKLKYVTPAVAIIGIDSLILNDIARDTANHFDALAPVYKMPPDTDMKDFQRAQPGKYKVMHGVLLFTPDTAFIKGQTYFVRYYQYRTSHTMWDFLSNRKSVRGTKYNDLIFKP